VDLHSLRLPNVSISQVMSAVTLLDQTKQMTTVK